MPIHFHVWSPSEFTELLEYTRGPQDLPFELEALRSNQHEFIAVLRRV